MPLLRTGLAVLLLLTTSASLLPFARASPAASGADERAPDVNSSLTAGPAQCAAPLDLAARCYWAGTAPFCAGKCRPGDREIRRDSKGDGARCWTGTKAYCCPPGALPGSRIGKGKKGKGGKGKKGKGDPDDDDDDWKPFPKKGKKEGKKGGKKTKAGKTKTKAVATKTKAVATKTKAIATKTKAAATRTKAVATKTKAAATKTKAASTRTQAISTKTKAVATKTKAAVTTTKGPWNKSKGASTTARTTARTTVRGGAAPKKTALPKATVVVPKPTRGGKQVPLPFPAETSSPKFPWRKQSPGGRPEDVDDDHEDREVDTEDKKEKDEGEDKNGLLEAAGEFLVEVKDFAKMSWTQLGALVEPREDLNDEEEMAVNEGEMHGDEEEVNGDEEEIEGDEADEQR